jgi:hypothetical protein
MDKFELDYENDEERIEFMTRTPWLKNKTTGKIVYSREGYPIGDNARDPRWKGYPLSLHFNNGIMNLEPVTTGPTEFYMSDGHYAMYRPKPNDALYEPHALDYSELLRERYQNYLNKVTAENKNAYKAGLKELSATKRAMEKELEKEYSKLKQLEIRSGREEAAKKRKIRAAARRGIDVAPDDESIKETYDSKLAEITKLEKILGNVKILMNQLKININGI